MTVPAYALELYGNVGHGTLGLRLGRFPYTREYRMALRSHVRVRKNPRHDKVRQIVNN